SSLAEVRKKQGQPGRNRVTRSPDRRTTHLVVRGRTGSSPAHPFGSLAATDLAFAGRSKAHSFASPSFDGFALSRMKGVGDPGGTSRLATAPTTKTGEIVRYWNLERICREGKSRCAACGVALSASARCLGRTRRAQCRKRLPPLFQPKIAGQL